MQNYFTTRNLIIALIIVVIIAVGVWFFFVRDGEPVEEGTPSGSFPSGNGRDSFGGDTGSGDEFPPVGANTAQTLQLVSENVSGAIFSNRKIRYIERATGHVFEIGSDGENKTRISNTTIPGIFEVLWSPDGSRAILKYISNGDLNIFSARFAASSTQGIFLSPEIEDITFSPAGDRILYALRTETGSSIVRATPDNTQQSVILRNPFSSWRIFWPSANNIYALTAPSVFSEGFLYKINTAAGALEKITGPKAGLSFSTNGQTAIVSESDEFNKTITSYRLNLQSGALTQFGVKILPEKCIWSKLERGNVFCAMPLPLMSALYPDDWYKGLVSFRDILVKINTENASATEIPINETADIISPFLSESENALFYINKKDGSLWRVNLK